MKYLLYTGLLMLCFCTKKKTKEEPVCIGCGVLPPVSEKMAGSYCVAGSLNISYYNQYIYVKISHKYFYSDGDKINPYNNSVNTTNKDTFQFYAKSYNDFGYHQSGSVGNILIDTIANISVLTKYDLNDTHKASDTINDLVQIRYISVYDYIQSRYTKGEIFLNTSLTEFNSKQRLMVKAEDMQLVLPTISPKPTKQQYEVRIRFTSGKLISDTTELITNE